MRYFQKLMRLVKDKNTGKGSGTEGEEKPQALSGKIQKDLEAIKAEFGDSCDLIVREFYIGSHGQIKVALVFLDGMVNLTLINDDIIKPLMHNSRFAGLEGMHDISSLNVVHDRLLSAGEVKTAHNLCEVTEACLSGDAVLLMDGVPSALDIGVKGWDKRAVSEPSTETVVRGPREGFTENLRTNTALIRRKIQNPALKMNTMMVGKRTRTRINVMYIEGIANPDLVTEVKRRLNNINTDAILAAGYIDQYIEDAPYSVFQTIWYSEKPDAIAGNLLEGRVAIVVDGTPFVLSVPMLFMENFHTSEDYSIRSYYATALRILRLVAFIISVFGPALYVSLTTFHQELIPTTLLFTMAASSEGVPFPAAAEAAVMLFTFEILREAGVRMPRSLGQAISIVGALVMGQSAVQAGFVGAPVVIVIAITAVSSFVIPFAVDAISVIRWFILILAAVMGNYGITIGIFILLVHLASLKSFGANYLAPIAPFQPADLKDTAVRAPLWAMRTRPRALSPIDVKRQDFEIPFDPTAKQKGGRGKKS